MQKTIFFFYEMILFQLQHNNLIKLQQSYQTSTTLSNFNNLIKLQQP